jgi:hypothetical protein
MKLLLAALLALQAPSCFAQGALASAKPSSLIVFVGTVKLLRHGAFVEEPVRRAPLALEDGDRIVTGPNGEATVRLKDGSELRLAADSQAEIGRQSREEVLVRLWAGKLWAKVSKMRARSFEVRTPYSVASVRGTEFSVALLGTKVSVTEVQSGLVAVRALLEDKPVGAEALLREGQSVKVEAGKLGPTTAVQAATDAPKSGAAASGMTPDALALEGSRQLSQEAMQRAAIGSNISPQPQESTAGLQMTALSAAAAGVPTSAAAPPSSPAAAPVATVTNTVSNTVTNTVTNAVTNTVTNTGSSSGASGLLPNLPTCQNCPKLP